MNGHPARNAVVAVTALGAVAAGAWTYSYYGQRAPSSSGGIAASFSVGSAPASTVGSGAASAAGSGAPKSRDNRAPDAVGTLGTTQADGASLSPDAFESPADLGMSLPKVPERLPNFSLADRTGKQVPISTWRDKSLIINFWATWCAPCRHEIPLLQSLRREWGPRDVEVIGIAVDHSEPVKAYADQLQIAYPLLIGEQDALDVATAFGFDAPVFPFTVFTDRRGEVVVLYVGELHPAQADLILDEVQSLNENRVRLADARRRLSVGLAALGHQHPG